MKKKITTALATLISLYAYSQEYQPLENQRVSTSNNVSFNKIIAPWSSNSNYARLEIALTNAVYPQPYLGVLNSNPQTRVLNLGIAGSIPDAVNSWGAKTGTRFNIFNENGNGLSFASYLCDGIEATGSFNINTVNGGAVNVGGALTLPASATINTGGNYLLRVTDGYTRLYRGDGVTGIFLGGAGDPANYYDNTSHRFRGANGTYAIISASDFTSTVPFTGTSANFTGNVGIGTTTPSEMLSVNGKIRAREIKVETINWPDYVFHGSYKLPDLKATEQFIKENNHLPEIPSAAEVANEGVNLGEMNAKLLKKIEELTLYLIELKKDNDQIKTDNKNQQKEIDQLKSKL